MKLMYPTSPTEPAGPVSSAYLRFSVLLEDIREMFAFSVEPFVLAFLEGQVCYKFLGKIFSGV